MQRTRWSAVVMGLVLLATACGNDPAADGVSSTTPPETTTTTEETTSSTNPPTTTTTEPPEPTRLRDVEGETRSGIGWLAEPGLYVAYVDGRTITLDLPEAFTYIPRRTDLILAPADIPPGIQIISFALTSLEGVIQAAHVGAPPDDSTVSEVTESAPDLLSDWLDAVSQMNTSSLAAAEGADWVAQAWDMTVDPSAGETFPCPYGNCLATLVPKGAGVYIAGDEFGFRLWQFDGAAEGLYGFAQSPLDELDAAEAFYDMVLSGLKIED